MNGVEIDVLKELVAAAGAVVSLNTHPGRAINTHTISKSESVDFRRLSYEVWPRFHRAIETARLVLYPLTDSGVSVSIKSEAKMNRKLLQRIDELFAGRLQAKTGWGRNDVLQLYRECVNEALMELLD